MMKMTANKTSFPTEPDTTHDENMEYEEKKYGPDGQTPDAGPFGNEEDGEVKYRIMKWW